MESFSTGAQNYRHQFLVHSTDGGMTWNADEACDLTPDEDFDGYEAVFGSIAPDVVNGQLEIIYQRDFEPGLHVRGDEDPADINDIVHLRIPAEDLGDCIELEYEDWVGVAEPIELNDIALYPNPADDQVEWSSTARARTRLMSEHDRACSLHADVCIGERIETSDWAPAFTW